MIPKGEQEYGTKFDAINEIIIIIKIMERSLELKSTYNVYGFLSYRRRVPKARHACAIKSRGSVLLGSFEYMERYFPCGWRRARQHSVCFVRSISNGPSRWRILGSFARGRTAR